ncbi:low density lipoprotein receptor adapter protein 1 isoform X2 [Larus michahellis]|uniref:low density lipoprotein receptor adapter protein 1 isoform X2 n=1 Tax=Larus michahellis TaxID=119627 RepID=UPI003D9AEC98
MDALKSAGRALLRSPSVHKPSWAGGRHKKLPENWTDTRETLLEGMLFSLKYMGMTLVEQPKGEELSAAAVKRIVATAKASGKKLQKVTLKVSPRGIVLNDSGTNELIENVSIYRISYCTADKIHDKVFAYIAQNQLNENLECHAFLCTKRKMAQAVTLTVAQAFKIAFELWQAAKEEKEKRERSMLEGEGPSSPSSEAAAHPDAPATGNLLDLEDPAKSPLTSSANSPRLDNSMFGPSSSVNNNVVWEMDDGLDEAFSRPAGTGESSLPAPRVPAAAWLHRGDSVWNLHLEFVHPGAFRVRGWSFTWLSSLPSPNYELSCMCTPSAPAMLNKTSLFQTGSVEDKPPRPRHGTDGAGHPERGNALACGLEQNRSHHRRER